MMQVTKNVQRIFMNHSNVEDAFLVDSPHLEFLAETHAHTWITLYDGLVSSSVTVTVWFGSSITLLSTALKASSHSSRWTRRSSSF